MMSSTFASTLRNYFVLFEFVCVCVCVCVCVFTRDTKVQEI